MQGEKIALQKTGGHYENKRFTISGKKVTDISIVPVAKNFIDSGASVIFYTTNKRKKLPELFDCSLLSNSYYGANSMINYANFLAIQDMYNLEIVQDTEDATNKIFWLCKYSITEDNDYYTLIFKVNADYSAKEKELIKDIQSLAQYPLLDRAEEYFSDIEYDKKFEYIKTHCAEYALEGYFHFYAWYSRKGFDFTSKAYLDICLQDIDVNSWIEKINLDNKGYVDACDKDFIELDKEIRANLRRYALLDRYNRKLAWRKNWLNLLGIE